MTGVSQPPVPVGIVTSPEIEALVQQNALFVINHSSGKDSQAMFLLLREYVPSAQLLVIHADLPEVDWEGSIEHIQNTIDDIPLVVTRAKKTFFQMVEHRKMWPSPKYRQCTSDLKRGPIEKEIRTWLKSHPDHKNRVVNCMGLRAEESSNRAKAVVFKKNLGNSIAGREWYDWLPIHRMTTPEVFDTIRTRGQEPHWAYKKGMTRLSCRFCIMASKQDLRTAAKLNPELYRRYVETEKKLKFTFLMPTKKGGAKGLEDVTGIMADGTERAAPALPADVVPAGDCFIPETEMELEHDR